MHASSSIDHLALSVTDLERSAHLYDALLGPLGCVRHFTRKDLCMWHGPARCRTTRQATMQCTCSTSTA